MPQNQVWTLENVPAFPRADASLFAVPAPAPCSRARADRGAIRRDGARRAVPAWKGKRGALPAPVRSRALRRSQFPQSMRGKAARRRGLIGFRRVHGFTESDPAGFQFLQILCLAVCSERGGDRLIFRC